VKHVKIAVRTAMAGQESVASEALEYLRTMVRRQERAGADFLDLNVDEISLKLEEQKGAMQWLVRTVEGMSYSHCRLTRPMSRLFEQGWRAAMERPGEPC
jgi:predicted solute-binding protein